VKKEVNYPDLIENKELLKQFTGRDSNEMNLKSLNSASPD
jgi:hypothetical protein